MEKGIHCVREDIVSALIHGCQVANQLKNQLQPGSSDMAYELLMDKIVCSYDTALSLLNSRNFQVTGKNNLRNHTVFRKRRNGESLREPMIVSSETVEECVVSDGYSWRKYGQKAILGTKHPRAYYRCTNKPTQGCLATKHIQQTDEDPFVFQVVYKGEHSCVLEKNKQNHSNFYSTGIKMEEFQELDDTKEPARDSHCSETYFFHDAMEQNESSFSFPENKAKEFCIASSESYFNESKLALEDIDIGVGLDDWDSDFVNYVDWLK